MSEQFTPPAAHPAIILVRPQMGENIGASARAMWNFGLHHMRVVAPRDGWPNERAVALASGAGRVLDAARLVDTTAEACADCDFVFATTARDRDLTKPVFTPEAAMQEAAKGGGGASADVAGTSRSTPPHAPRDTPPRVQPLGPCTMRERFPPNRAACASSNSSTYTVCGSQSTSSSCHTLVSSTSTPPPGGGMGQEDGLHDKARAEQAVEAAALHLSGGQDGQDVGSCLRGFRV